MREASLMHHEIRDEFFANREPSVREWQELRGAGVALLALCRPTMVLAGQVVRDRPVGFSFARAGDTDAERAFLIAVEDEDGRFLDIAAWQPMRSWVGLWLGRAWALGQARVHDPRLGEEGALPVWRSPLNWLRAGREGIVLIRPERRRLLPRRRRPASRGRPGARFGASPASDQDRAAHPRPRSRSEGGMMGELIDFETLAQANGAAPLGVFSSSPSRNRPLGLPGHGVPAASDAARAMAADGRSCHAVRPTRGGQDAYRP